MHKIQLRNQISQTGIDQLIQRATLVDANPDAIIVRSANLHDEIFDASLLAIARAGIGVNNIPIDRCSEQGIVVFNTPGANANAVKELALTGMLLASRDILGGIKFVQENADKPDLDTLIEKQKAAFTGVELQYKTLGIIGLGAIGVLLANAASSLGMHVIGYDPYISVASAWGLSKEVNRVNTLEALYAQSDYISIHVPLMPQTHHLINKQALDNTKEGVVILNFARAELVDDQAMKQALETHHVKRYVSDFPNKTTANMKNTITIPHLGASTFESTENCAIMAVNQVLDYLQVGSIVNSVNFPNCVLGMCQTANRITLLHHNIPNMVSQITNIVGMFNLNIESMQNVSKKQLAYTVLDVDKRVDFDMMVKLKSIEGILKVRLIPGMV